MNQPLNISNTSTVCVPVRLYNDPALPLTAVLQNLDDVALLVAGPPRSKSTTRQNPPICSP